MRVPRRSGVSSYDDTRVPGRSGVSSRSAFIVKIHGSGSGSCSWSWTGSARPLRAPMASGSAPASGRASPWPSACRPHPAPASRTYRARRQQEAQQPLLRQVQAGRREVSAPPARLEQRDSRGGGRQAGLPPRVRVGAAAACSSQASPPPRGALLSPHPSWLRSVLLPWAVGDGGRAGGQGGAQAGQAAAEAAAHARAGAASTVSSHVSRRAVCAGNPSPHGLPPPPLGASHPCGPCG